MKAIASFTIALFLCSPALSQEKSAYSEGGFHVRIFHDGSGSVSRSEDVFEPRWSFDCRVDAMSDKRMCSFHRGIGGVFVSYDGTSSPQSICAFGHDFPGQSAMIRVDKLPPVETDTSGCTSAAPLLEQLIAGSIVTVRRYEWPRDWPLDEASTLDGFHMTMKVIDREFFGSSGLRPPPDEVPGFAVQIMINSERELNRRCRGTEGADPTSTVCSERDEMGNTLNKIGWCYGKNDQPGYLNKWHKCAPGSWGYQP